MDPLQMDKPREHCPHCGRGSNFHLPQITIDWDQINRAQFENSRAALTGKLQRIMESREGAYWSSNWFTAPEMYVIDALLKAASVNGDEQKSNNSTT